MCLRIPQKNQSKKAGCNMRVLVTGGGGFIGSAVRRLLEANGDEMVTFDHVDGNDVMNKAQLLGATHEIDAVINLAGRLGTSETFGHEYPTAEVNILGAINVADVCRTRGIPLVQIGTGHKGQPNPYAITKACAEELLIARAQETGQQISVVRAYHAYGPGQKPFPPHGKSTVRKIMPSFICRALTGMPIEVNDSGEQVIDLIHVDEVARILVKAISGPYGYVLEAGTGHGVTVNRAALDVIDFCQSKSTIIHIPKRAGEPVDAVVIAEIPESDKLWPWGLDNTVDYYRKIVS